MQVGDKFRLHSDNGKDYDVMIVNINDYREPAMKYACDMWCDGVYAGDVIFLGDDFFEKNQHKLDKLCD